MDQTRLFIVFTVILCMIFTLGILHHYSRRPAPPRSPSGSDPGWSAGARAGADSLTPVPPHGNPFTSDANRPTGTVLPPPSFCYGTTSPDETDQSFRDGAERMSPAPPPKEPDRATD